MPENKFKVGALVKIRVDKYQDEIFFSVGKVYTKNQLRGAIGEVIHVPMTIPFWKGFVMVWWPTLNTQRMFMEANLIEANEK